MSLRDIAQVADALALLYVVSEALHGNAKKPSAECSSFPLGSSSAGHSRGGRDFPAPSEAGDQIVPGDSSSAARKPPIVLI